MQAVLWEPDRDRREASAIMDLARKHGFDGDDAIERLRQWSVDEPQDFWKEIWELGQIRASSQPCQVLRDGDRMPGARWFSGSRLNFAQNLLRRNDTSPAIIAYTEDGVRREISWQRLNSEVRALAAALRADGVNVGDRVAGYLPNMPEAIIAMLASAAIGAVWSSASPDFGVSGVLDRFGQIEPKVLISVDGYRYAGKKIDIRDKVRDVSSQLPSLRRTVLVPFLDEGADVGPVRDAVLYCAYKRKDPAPLEFAQLPFD
ncbi:MAG: AMP-binding protein, partial [Geminicoccaceae bacterium]|nr:AMP-binding protein [Geminicoccaceae bacterium]